MSGIWKSAAVSGVRLAGGLLAERQKTVLRRTIPQQYQQCLSTGRLTAIDRKWTQGGTVPKPHQFWDSDVAKWIESTAYALMLARDPQLESQVDEVVERMEKAQLPDGYVNSYFQSIDLSKRFTNLRDLHELYCAGHLMEAAVAYFEATGKRKLLDILCRYGDLIRDTFGKGGRLEGGYDGHEEVELGLIKLGRATGNASYIDLARQMVEARGTKPWFFDTEAVARGEDPRGHSWLRSYEYFQAERPIREQTTVDGHSVRAMYFLAGVADVAAETGDASLLKVCRQAFENCVQRRMYITGGIGSTRHGEQFTFDFDLPNESAYAETCASIGLVFFAHRMLQLERDGKYADVIETALYNGVMSGMSLDGEKYFYANYLATDPRWHYHERGFPAERQGWFECACCPPNLARLLTSIGAYAYSVGPGEVAVNLYCDSEASLEVDGRTVSIRQTTAYPWDGAVKLTLKGAGKMSLLLRVPGWCAKWKLKVNGKSVAATLRKGYLRVARKWADGDRVELVLEMPVRRVYSDVRVRHNGGRVALARGPVVYCLEQVDNGSDVNALVLPKAARVGEQWNPKLLGGVVALSAKAVREVNGAGGKELYTVTRPKRKAAKVRAVPYYAWANRGGGEMTVWIRSD